jgi:CheY-like chemotaxis protein
MSTILLVDDEAEFLDLYTEVLELMEHRVLRAHDGREALELAHARRPDLVVTDWQMPRMSGVELCQQLLEDEELHGIPILMHSTERDPHAPGVTAFVSKCSELSRFEELVHQMLSGLEANRSPDAAHQTPWSLEPVLVLLH